MSKKYLLADEIFMVRSREEDLDAPFWQGTRDELLLIQRCKKCSEFQWGPEYICHRCHSFDLHFESVYPTGKIYSWARVWHPPHPELADSVPYWIVIVALDDAPGVRMVGNLISAIGDKISIGDSVTAAYEHHDEYTLVQWRLSRYNI